MKDKHGREVSSYQDKKRLEKMEEKTNVISVFKDVRKKDELEKKAFEALERRLEPKTKTCKACNGDGEKPNGDTCYLCQGKGIVIEDADMRAIELVLAPKFPKTNLNVNADLEGMSTEELFKAIEKM